MKITWLGHSAFRVETGASVILIDPFLKGNPTFEASGYSWDRAIADVTHVALTHGHDDHVGDTLTICELTGAKLFAVFELAMYLAGKGVEHVEPMNTGGTVHGKNFDLSLVDARHSSSSDGIYLGNPCGVVIRAHHGKTLLHMGDTDVFPGMGLIAELYQPNIGIVPIGDRFTMGAANAAFACKKYFNFEAIFPCHYGTFPIIDATADKFVAAMKGHNVHVPSVGDVVKV